MASNPDRLADALRAIYDRPQPPVPWVHGVNLPWDDPAFSERMLAQHLDQSHGAASRPAGSARPGAGHARLAQPPSRRPAARRDVRAGTLCRRVCAGRHQRDRHRLQPASPLRAKPLAGLPCRFIQADVRMVDFGSADFAPPYDAAMYIYGQFTVLTPDESRDMLRRIHAALRPGGRLLLEILDDAHFDKRKATGGTRIAAGCGATSPTCTWANAAGTRNSGPRSSGSTSSTSTPASCRPMACPTRRIRWRP